MPLPGAILVRGRRPMLPTAFALGGIATCLLVFGFLRGSGALLPIPATLGDILIALTTN